MLLALEEKKGAISTVVENSTDHLKVKGSSPATAWREKSANKVL
jgi:hypothetical protein